jgi:type VI secretion system protein ImpH
LKGLGFYALLSLFERLSPSGPRVGETSRPREERLRLRHDASLAFSPGDIARARLVPGEGATGSLLEVVTAFLGLTGAVTPLPSYLAEEAAGEDAEAKRIRSFLDLFHHRLLSILYRGIAKYRLTYESTSSADDAWSRRVLALSGVDALLRQVQDGALRHAEDGALRQAEDGALRQAQDGALRQAQDGALPTSVLLRLAPLLADESRPVRSLELALEEALRVALGEEALCARVEQFVRAWVQMTEPDRMALGERNCTLGRRAVLGRHMFVRGGFIRIHLTGLTSSSHARLASGELRERVGCVVRLFTRESSDFELALELERAQRPRFELGRPASGRIGFDAFVTCIPPAVAPSLSLPC